MMQINIKRCLSLMLALVLTFSLLPVSALAEEEAETIAIETTSPTETTSATEAPEETTSAAEETEPTIPETTVPMVIVEETAPVVAAASEDPETSTAYQAVQAKMDEILETYKVAKLTEEEIPEAVADMDEDTWFNALIAVEDLDNSEDIQALTEEELLELAEKNPLFCAFAEAVYERASMPDDAGLYTSHSLLSGQLTVADSANSSSVSGTTVTITAKGSLFSKKTNNITITNKSGSKAQLSFDYAATFANSFKIAGSTAAASGSYSIVLDADASLSITLVSNSGLSNTTATLKLSNFSLSAVADSSKIAFEFDSNFGSITVAGTAITSGDEQTIPGTGALLAATPVSGAVFHGWIDSDGKMLSKEASYTLMPTSDMTVKAVFTGSGSNTYWGVGAATQKSVSSGLLGMSKIYYHTVGDYSYIFDDLNAAANAAAASTSAKVVVLLNDATLPAGDYTIPAGVTLLIPFDADRSLYTTNSLNTDTYTKPTAYRTLTMADGANLIINGAMSLSAKHRYAQGGKTDGASPTGAVSFVRMQGDSNITINSGGTLYAYGFITGSGSVTANSGANIYELFQFMDFRGGTQSTDMQNGVFPLSQYYVQNIEVPMTIYSGAKEYAGTTIYMSSADFTSNVNFISNKEAMFNLTSGYAIKKYDGTTDRLKLDLFGDTTISSVEIKVSTSSINSKDYELPLNGNITITVHSGVTATINQDLAVLPGAEIYIEEDATITIGSGNNIYVYDADEWGTFCGAGNKKFIPLTYAPGRTHTRTEAELKDAAICVDGTVDANAGYIYTTAGGANIYSTGAGVVKINPGTQTVTHQLVQGTGYTEIPITSAKLKHGDGTYLATGDAGQGAGEYYYNATHQKWVKGGHTDTSTEVIFPTCTDQGYTDHTCACGYDYKDTYVEALGHTGGTANCVDKAICTRCSTAYGDIDSTKHKTPVADAAKAPTCTETGLTVGSHCSACNAVIVGQEELPALGHKYDSGTETPPTASTEGFITYTCQNDSTHTKTETINVAQVGEKQYTILDNALNEVPENGTVTLLHSIDGGVEIDKAMTIQKGSYEANILPATGYYISEETNTTVTIQKRIIAGTSVRAGDCLDIYFYIADLEGDDYEARITRVEKGETIREDPIPASKWSDSGNYRRFAYTGIAAKEMTDTVTVTIYDKAGKQVSETTTESIEAYALRTLEKRGGDELNTALVDMLNYGADAQIKFNHNINDLPNADLTDVQKAFATQNDVGLTQGMTGTIDGEVRFTGASVTAGSTLYLNFYFEGITAADKSDYRAVLKYTDHYGNGKERNISGSDFEDNVKSNGTFVYGPQLTGLAVADGRCPVTCEIYKGDTKIAEATASVEGYVNATIQSANSSEALKTVCKSLMKFVDSAHAYFRSLES